MIRVGDLPLRMKERSPVGIGVGVEWALVSGQSLMVSRRSFQPHFGRNVPVLKQLEALLRWWW